MRARGRWGRAGITHGFRYIRWIVRIATCTGHHPAGLIGRDQAQRLNKQGPDPGGGHIVELAAIVAVVEAGDGGAGDGPSKDELGLGGGDGALVVALARPCQRAPGAHRVAEAAVGNLGEEQFHGLRRVRRPLRLVAPFLYRPLLSGRRTGGRSCAPAG